MLKYDANLDSFTLTVVGMRHQDPAIHDMYKKYLSEGGFPLDYRFAIRRAPTLKHPHALGVYVYTQRGAKGELIGHIKDEQSYELDARYGHLKNLKWWSAGGAEVHIASSLRQFYFIVALPIADGVILGSNTQVASEKATNSNPSINSSSNTTMDSSSNTTMNSNTKTNKKATTMSNTIIDKNMQVATTAAYMEAGRIANNQAAKLVSSKAPLMVRGYVDTAMGKLLIANAANLAASKFRPADKRLETLTIAMMTQAWQEVYQIVDLDKMLDEMLESDSLKRAFKELDKVINEDA